MSSVFVAMALVLAVYNDDVHCIPTGGYYSNTNKRIKKIASSGGNTKTEEYDERVRGFKEDLLIELGMHERPLLSTESFPKGPIENYYRKRDGNVKSKSATIVSSKVTNDSRCPEGKPNILCLRFEQAAFNLPGTIYKNMYLLVFQAPDGAKMGGQMGVVGGAGFSRRFISIKRLDIYDKTKEKLLLKSYHNKNKKGWAQLYIGGVSDWVQKNRSLSKISVTIKLECHKCKFLDRDHTGAMTRPMVSVIMAHRIHHNTRRGKCKSESDECCLEDFWVDFKQIGWQDWIGAPDRINIGRCRGRCHSTPSALFGKTHPEIAKALMNNVELKERINKGLCCVPKRYGHETLIYQKNNKFVSRIFENMIITECQCG